MANEPGDNTPEETPEGANPPDTPNKPEPGTGQDPFPPDAGEIPGKEEEPEVDKRIKEIQDDPEYKKFLEESGTPEIAYKRWQDSSSEGTRLKSQLDDAIPFKEKYEEVEKDFNAISERDPELYKKLQETVSDIRAGKPAPTTDKTPDAPSDPSLTSDDVTRISQMQYDLAEFRTTYAETIKDDTEFANIVELAKGFSGRVAPDGQPYTLKKALASALKEYHPELVTDQATAEVMHSEEKRNSASEPGNSPTGGSSSSDAVSLTQEETEVAQKMGLTPEEYAEHKE